MLILVARFLRVPVSTVSHNGKVARPVRVRSDSTMACMAISGDVGPLLAGYLVTKPWRRSHA